ncbi:MAG TPA: toll/interleukin-1 receptor domain-containing protein [Pyrinomonadaceae bacterium]|nr:toll/interleukin-1 receptor domain-containing protein [Pyrinomonadaceae bacterium]
MADTTSARPKVFISYSHRDREWLERLQVHLKPLKGALDAWDDTRIVPGSSWREEIHAALAEAKVAILLVSADFVASDFIIAEELPALLKTAAAGGTQILAVVLSPAMLSAIGGLAELQTVNDPKSPLIGMDKARQEQLLLSIAYLVELRLRPQPAPATAAAVTDAAATAITTTAPPAANSDCRDYAAIFDIHIRRERRGMPLAYAAVVATPLFGLALIMGAWLLFDTREGQSAVVPLVAVMALVGFVSLGLSYVLMNKVREKYAAIDSCEFMKSRFDGCERWDAEKLREHVKLALDFLRKGMMRS